MKKLSLRRKIPGLLSCRLRMGAPGSFNDVMPYVTKETQRTNFLESHLFRQFSCFSLK